MNETRGFTLVEVMVALVVLALGVLALTQLSVSIAYLMKQAGAKTELVAQAENRIEEVEAQTFDSINGGTTEDTVLVRGIQYRRTVTVTEPSRRLREVTVALEPLTGSGFTYSTITYVSQ